MVMAPSLAERLKHAVSWVIWPSLVVVGVAAVHVGQLRGVPLPLVLGMLQVGMMGLISGLERWMPEHDSWRVAQGDVRTDAFYLVTSGVLLSGLLRTILFVWTPSFGLWPARWPVVVQFFLGVAVADLGGYATHVLGHKVPAIWPIHAPHHSARRLYWLNATRMHPLDQASTVAISLLPLALLGAGLEVLALLDAFAIVHLMLQHSNIRLRHGALSHVFATAEFHRWHHSRVRGESEHNYASFLSLWDHVFRTFRMPAEREPPVEVGLYDGATIPDGIGGQLRHPFNAWVVQRD
jgi:sterol desaturase/sphingolipid hydroxylase (fatty acid hydroxylase superfamily)